MPSSRSKPKLSLKEIAVFGLLAAVMFASKKLMEGLPNIHLVGVMIVAITVVYRVRALYSIYTYVMLDGLFGGFQTWWLPYLYIWAVLWGVTMLLPKKLPTGWQTLIYALACGLHGLAFGALYAPVQGLLFGWDLKRVLLWIAAGFPYDCIHGVSNFILGLILILPLVKLLERLSKT